MTLFLSRPFEELELKSGAGKPICVDTLIVGSGYGAAFSALALAMRDDFRNDKSKKIMVLERGNEYVPGDFPKTMSDLPAHVSVLSNDSPRTGYANALFDFRIGKNVMAMVGSGLGGTSLINAGVAKDPDAPALNRFPAPDRGTWSANLVNSIAFVRDVLQVQRHPRGYQLKKVQALARIAKSLGPQANHELADIAVNFQDGENNVGVNQAQCNDCGNCFTGCNIGAKNTLAMNAWPLAKSLGVDIVTGGTVDCVSKSTEVTDSTPTHRWCVVAHRTTDVSGTMVKIFAKTVILAAGTFGSTEILKRSSQEPLTLSKLLLSKVPLSKLPLSTNALGSKFSLNGDDIGFGFGQREAVEAYAKVPSARAVGPLPDEKPGPTIVSWVSVNNEGSRGLIEDATVPQAIARLWAEVMSTQAMTRAYVSDTPSAWHKDNPAQDPLAVSAALMDHHQVVLGMVDEQTFGQLDFSPIGPEYKYDRGQLSLIWPPAQSDPSAAVNRSWLDGRLTDAEKKQGFDGGLFLSNPLLRPLPESFDGVFEGASNLGGTHLCNHPLGGCPMGTDATTGVVNSKGQVFCDVNGTAVHDGLYVLDGSILPAALGINPYMTISALAHCLAYQIPQGGLPARGQKKLLRCRTAPINLPFRQGQRVDWPIPKMAFVFRERLFSSHRDPRTEQLRQFLGQVKDNESKHSLVIDAEIRIPDMYHWLTSPSQQLDASFTVYDCAFGFTFIDTVPEVELGAPLIRDARGVVTLLAQEPSRPSTVELAWRASAAFLRFQQLRGDEFHARSGVGTTDNRLTSGLSKVENLLRVAKQHGYWRTLDYRFEAELSGAHVTAKGRKTLSYDVSRNWDARDESNPWTTLSNLELTFSKSAWNERSVWFRVDLPRMAKNINALQLTALAETPQVVNAVASMAFLAVRVLVQTHLWSFGAPSRNTFPSREEIVSRYKLYDVPEPIGYANEPSKWKVTAIARPAEQEWRLLRILSNPTREPVLLIHGMAHSSRVFYTETIDRSLAGYLAKEGYDVWLLDHGLSIALEHRAGYAPTIDEISEHVTAAVLQVHVKTRKKVLIFSHCVGSAALSKSLLLGTLDSGNGSLVERLVMHAIPPWIYPSETNLLRAYLGVFFKDRFFPQTIDPIPKNENEQSPAIDTLLDRLAFSIPWAKADFKTHAFRDGDQHYGRTICNRMTAFYGYEWSHYQLDERTHKNLASLVGPADASSFRQLYFLLNRKRVTSALGVNDCLTQTNIARSWKFPTLFIHGRNNKVFDAESSVLAARQMRTLRRVFARIGEPQQPVKLAVIEGYGHMDLLFGKNAAEDVFPRIKSFFENDRRGWNSDMPKSFTQAPIRPMTGPIISNPKVRNDGKHWIRIWAETMQFQTSRSIDVVIKGIDPAGISLHLKAQESVESLLNDANGSATNELLNSNFWLADVVCDRLGCFVLCVVNEQPGVTLNQETNEQFIQEDKAIAATWIPRKELDLAIDWRKLSWFKRFTSKNKEFGLSFILGSCWHPGSWFDHDLSDRVFARMQVEIKHSDGPDHLLLVGDQIYGDASYAIFDIAEHRERYQESYRRAFNSPNARWVLSHIPTYFAVDDHEFRDNYPTPFPGDKQRPGDEQGDIEKLGMIGAQEAWNYQMSHGRRPNPGAGSSSNNQLWYSFSSGQFQFFVFDTRSERYFDGANRGRRQLIGTVQEEGFRAWCHSLDSYEPGSPVFLVTGSPLVPIPTDEMTHPALASSSDSLRAYPKFLRMVAAELAKNHCGRTVVWLSGDPHYSAMGRFFIRLRNPYRKLKCVAVVASGLSVPLPFANGRPDDVTWMAARTAASASTVFEPGENIQIRLLENELLSTSRGHALRVGITKDSSGSWILNVNVIDADQPWNSGPSVSWAI